MRAILRVGNKNRPVGVAVVFGVNVGRRDGSYVSAGWSARR
jgi:hypothetical protein